MSLAYDAMEPGGTVIIQDYMRIDDSPERKRLDALENLYVLVVFDSGAGYREGDVLASWLADAGFVDTSRIPLPPQLGLAVARKPQ